MRPVLFLAAVSACAVAPAATITQIVDYVVPYTFESGQLITREDITIQGFNPALGTLKAVTITAYAKAGGASTFVNTFNPNPASGTYGLLHNMSVGFWDALNFQQIEACYAAGVTTHNYVAPAFGTATSNFYQEVYNVQQTKSAPFNSALLDRFKSNGPITMRVINQSREYPFNSGTLQMNGSVKCRVKVIYTYY